MTLSIVSASPQSALSQIVAKKAATLVTDTVVPGVLSSVRSPVDSSSLYRRAAIVEVTLDGKTTDQLGWTPFLQRVEVNQRFGNVSEVVLTFHNPNQGMFTGSSAFTPGALITVSAGYPKLGQQNLGVFKAQVPEHIFAPEVGHLVKIRGLSGECIFAADGHHQRVWTDKSVAQIVSGLASEYGVRSVIEDTGPSLEGVVQSNETTWAFLKRQADIQGYSLWMDNDTLNFGKYSPQVSPGQLFFKAGNQSNVSEIRVQVSANRAAPSYRQAQVDLDSQAIVEVTGDSVDPINKYVFGKVSNAVSAEDIVTEGGQPRSVEFVVGQGLTFDSEETRNKLEGMSRSSKMAVVTLVVEGKGLEFVKAGETIPLIIGQADEFSGLFFVSEVTHRISNSPNDPDKKLGYTTQITLNRSFINPRTPAPKILKYFQTDFSQWSAFIDALIDSPFKSFAPLKSSEGPPGLGTLLETGVQAVLGD